MVSYLLTIVPPNSVVEAIEQVQKEFAANFLSEAALRRPVHATLFKPFGIPSPITSEQLGKLERLAAVHSPFPINLKDFNFFEQHRVLFIDVPVTPELKSINQQFTQVLKGMFDFDEKASSPYHPHFTIGFKDLSEAIFPEIKQAYKNRLFRAGFEVDHLTLFKRAPFGNKMMWDKYHELPLGTSLQSSLW